ncbi:MAG: hypothetical protein A2428_04380 [Bdellovibrionales bacterium RIFOXYC1_FULL_54_43]|nr:MAG: hypothetical protein A2428_04380 [Bdellovibrionales bacterium RIFOXYC1_FULL_54_43]OFZ79761.1 MAG: hypothetical protein A2603_12840 [Bdellovibrionales bacterium RIFOXYD1_FULL_55_31]
MSLFNFNQEELLTFFAVLVRYSVLFAILPFVGDRMIPTTVKVLLSLAVTIALFPALVARGFVNPGQAAIWGSTGAGIIGTIGLEVLFALVLGFTAKMTFDAISFAGNLAGNFMGFAAASTYDPHQESQTQVISEVQMAIAMLVFLVLDGHHLMLRAALGSYEIIGIGGAKLAFGATFSNKLIQMSGQVVRSGVELAAPVAISLFAVNVAFGVMAKAMPQLNVLVLSFAASALVGLVVMFLTIPEFQGAAAVIVGNIGDSMTAIMQAMAKGT